MADTRTIVSYGPSPTSSLLMVRLLDFGNPIRGYDHFLNLSTVTRRFGGTIESGELRLVPEGQKTSLKEVGVLTYCSSGTTPDAILQMRASDDSAWLSLGDSTGTISVETDVCRGTGTAWSTTIGTGTGASATYTTPCLATQGRYYVDTTPVTPTITGTNTITLSATLGATVYCYWENEPYVRMKVGDIIETTEGYSRVTSVFDSTTLGLEWYPSTTLVGTHHPAKQLVAGEGETVISANAVLDTLQLRVVVIPRNDPSSCDTVKVLGWVVNHIPAGPRQYKP